MFISTALVVSAWVEVEVSAVEVVEEELQLPKSRAVITAEKVDKAVLFIKSDFVCPGSRLFVRIKKHTTAGVYSYLNYEL
jgi:hypothetical protein